MNKRYWSGLLIVFILLDVAFTLWQNYQLPLDGDLVAIVFPASWYSQVLSDPFGWAVLTKHETYAATNRFFAHAAMGLYWKQVPFVLQRFTSPINSLYASSALFNTGVQVLLLFVLAAYVWRGGGGKPGKWGFWLAAALLVPLFQTEGFYEQMGITDRAITYTFFYAFPSALLLVLLWPFFRAAQQQRPLHLNPVQLLLLVLLMVVVAFNGPITTAAVAVLLFGISLYWARRRWQIMRGQHTPDTLPANWLSGQTLLLLGILGALSLYSIYIGRNNTENSHSHTLVELYKLLPKGIYQELTKEWGLPLLLLLVAINTLLVSRAVPASAERSWVLNSIRGAGLFAVVYTLLLPFGGYRDYRPFLIRYDSIMPVMLGLFYAYGVSTYFLLFQLRRLRVGYAAAVAVVAAVFMYVDVTTELLRKNDCERWSLDQLAHAPEPVVRLAPFCTVLSWNNVTDFHQSEMHAQMLHYWGVTSTTKLYYQE